MVQILYYYVTNLLQTKSLLTGEAWPCQALIRRKMDCSGNRSRPFAFQGTFSSV